MTGFSAADLTIDGFLGGRLMVAQPRYGYRAATDPVLLAAATPARSGQSVLELGCGVGVASLCLLHRLPDLAVTGLERQADYAELAQQNSRRNNLPLTVLTGDLGNAPPSLRRESFDHVIANPPYFRAGGGTAAQDPGRESAQREETPLGIWVDAALRRLKPGGWLTMIHLAERLPDLLVASHDRAGSAEILPVAAREGRAASRIILRLRKGGKAPARLLPPLVLHDGSHHRVDGDDFTALARAVLRDGAALPNFDL
ncbi:MAG: methyltransferase [Paracoccaceae bacterium]